MIVPRGDTVLQTADEVLAVVHSAEKPQLAAILGPAAAGSSRGVAAHPYLINLTFVSII